MYVSIMTGWKLTSSYKSAFLNKWNKLIWLYMSHNVYTVTICNAPFWAQTFPDIYTCTSNCSSGKPEYIKYINIYVKIMEKKIQLHFFKTKNMDPKIVWNVYLQEYVFSYALDMISFDVWVWWFSIRLSILSFVLDL